MRLSSQLLVGGGTIYAALGGAHALYTVADVREPRRFAPSQREVHEAMVRSTVRVTSGRTTMWDAWLGFNLSHSLGVIIFGGIGMILGLFQGGLLATPLVLTVLVGISLIYLLLAVRYWFYLPVIGIVLATACFGSALVLVVIGE